MTQPATMPAQPPPGRGKPTTAAALFLLMFLLSATMMVWSGWQLWHGEQLPPALTQTGTRCSWVAQVDTPAEALAAWQALEGKSELPAEVTTVVHVVGPLLRGLVEAGLKSDQPWIVCGAPNGWVITLAAEPGQAAKLAALQSTWVPLLPGAPNPTQSAVVEEHGVVRLSVALTGTADELLAVARPEIGKTDAHLGTYEPFRAAVERVGGGSVHLFVAGPLLQRWAASTVTDHQARADLQWLGLGLRQDDDRLRLHAQVGVGQRGAAWLKEVADVSALDDVGGWIAADAQAAAVVRLPAKTRARLAGHYGPHAQLWTQALGHAAGGKAQTLVWQQTPEGEAALWTGEVEAPPGVPHALIRGMTLVASTPSMLARTREVLGGQRPSQASGIDRDRSRLWTHTQGWFAGPLQADWVWTDTGLAAEMAWLNP